MPKPTIPFIDRTGEAGNIFVIMGRTAKALIDADDVDGHNIFYEKVKEAIRNGTDYEGMISICLEFVNEG